MALLNFSAPYLVTPHPPAPQFYQPPQPFAPLPPPQGPYSYPRPEKPFLREEYDDSSQFRGSHNFQNPQQDVDHQHHIPNEPTFTKVTDEGSKTKVHAVIDYDYEEEDDQGAYTPVTPIQGPIFIRNGSVPVVPLYSHPVLNNGTFVQIPVSKCYKISVKHLHEILLSISAHFANLNWKIFFINFFVNITIHIANLK